MDARPVPGLSTDELLAWALENEVYSMERWFARVPEEKIRELSKENKAMLLGWPDKPVREGTIIALGRDVPKEKPAKKASPKR